MKSYTVTSEVLTEYKHWALSRKILHEIFASLSSKAKRSQVKAGLENTLMNLLFTHQTSGADLFMKTDTDTITSGFGYADLRLNPEEAEDCLRLIKNTFSNTTESVTGPEIVKVSSDAFEAGDFKLERNQYIDKAFNFVRSKTDEETAANAVLRSALRYASIYAETRHIGPPQEVYDLFYDWGIRNEGFASPFNARVLGKPEAKFYSLFKDTDEIFGSAGSFFNLDKPQNPGHWCLDPPFTKELMTSVDSILKDWLATYTDLSVLLIIPESHTPANRPDETVTLKKGIHYYEGLEGVLKALPVNVCIHRYGNLEGFSAEAILRGYSK
ncbi:CTD-interacting factor [Psychroflexus sp. YR1-1]|uniref:CTD-interacting factor n=1 Tax=Psychroflexus aurantiacus TaxID=2709310 RepID=A0A6B3R5P7_9FLAO|nr:CTD-interacting factor [Psychroflexus aurantiacus]NEV93161.1 CTD-interacting factor [Psychroflexus aurantiacus]